MKTIGLLFAFLLSSLVNADAAKSRAYPWHDERWGTTPIKFRSLPTDQLRAMGFSIAGDWPTLQTVHQRLNRLLAARDYELLERAFKEIDTVQRCENGEWISGLPTQLNWFKKSPSETEFGLEEEWKAKIPNSEYVHYFEALHWYRNAWKARTGEFAAAVTADRFEAFYQYLAKSKRIIAERGDYARNSGLYSLLEIAIMAVDNTPPDALLKRFKEMQTKWPQYLPIYLAVSGRMLPKWGGTPQMFHNFSKINAVMAFPEHAPSALARLYSAYTDQSATAEIASQNWEEIRSSYEEWLKVARSVERKVVLQRFKQMSCNVGDGKTTLRVHDALKNEGLLGETYRVDNDPCLSTRMPSR